jgi:hypothetical protein
LPYNPSAIGETDRSNQYRFVWLGVAGAVFSASNLFIGIENLLSAVALGFMAGGPLSVAYGARSDEYLRSLMDVGLRWMSAALGGYLLVLFFIGLIDGAHDLGYALGGGEARAPSSATQWLAISGLVVAIALCLVFYAGFAFQYCRDHFAASADE